MSIQLDFRPSSIGTRSQAPVALAWKPFQAQLFSFLLSPASFSHAATLAGRFACSLATHEAFLCASAMPLGLAACIFPGILPASAAFALGPRLAPLLPLLLLFPLLQNLWAAPWSQDLCTKGAACRVIGQAGHHCLASLLLRAAPAVHAPSARDNLGTPAMHGMQ